MCTQVRGHDDGGVNEAMKIVDVVGVGQNPVAWQAWKNQLVEVPSL